MDDQSPAKGLRIPALDGLRGLAIALVVLFHGFARWPDLVPWVTRYRDFPLFKFGYLGVELFFWISGFVIFMSLDKTAGLGNFLYKRWLRLFPAMLIACVLIVTTGALLPERPFGAPRLLDVIPALTFIDTGVLNAVFPLHFDNLEGSFWSLFVEVKFYLIFGALYFFDAEKAFARLTGLFMAGWVVKSAAQLYPVPPLTFVNAIVNTGLSLNYFGLFALGCAMYLELKHQNRRYLYVALALLIPAIGASVGYRPGSMLFCFALYAIFRGALLSAKFSHMVSGKVLTTAGFISYPLYLINENMLVALTIKLHQFLPDVPGLLTPVPGLMVICALAYLIAAYFEPWLRRAIQQLFTARSAAPEF